MLDTYAFTVFVENPLCVLHARYKSVHIPSQQLTWKCKKGPFQEESSLSTGFCAQTHGIAGGRVSTNNMNIYIYIHVPPRPRAQVWRNTIDELFESYVKRILQELASLFDSM